MQTLRAYVIAGLSVFTLGYCAGHCGRSETSAAPAQPSPLEQTITSPTSPAQEPQQPAPRPPTPEERLLHFLRQPHHSPAQAHPDFSFQREASLSDDCRGLLKNIKRCLQQHYTNIRNEVQYTYFEAKDYLKGAIK